MFKWVWVVSFSVLGSTPEHGSFGAFETKVECEQALAARRQAMRAQGKEVVGSCYVTQRATGNK